MPRDDIARKLGIATGTVTNIIKEWMGEVGRLDTEATREFAVEARKNNISVPDCMAGARTNALIRYLGLDVEKTEDFLAALVRILADKVAAEKVAKSILDMEALSNKTAVSFTQVPAKIEQFNEELAKTEEQTRNALARRDEAVAAANVATTERDKKVKEVGLTLAALDQYIHDEQELAKNNLSMRDRSSAIRVINHIKQNPSAEKIFEKLQKIDSLDLRQQEIQGSINKLQPREAAMQQSLHENTRQLEMLESRIKELEPIRKRLEEDIKLVSENGIASIRQMARECSDTMKADVQDCRTLYMKLTNMLIEAVQRMDEKDKNDRMYLESMQAVREFAPFVKRIARRENVSEDDFILSCIMIVEVISKSLPLKVQLKANTFSLSIALKEYLWSLKKSTTV